MPPLLTNQVLTAPLRSGFLRGLWEQFHGLPWRRHGFLRNVLILMTSTGLAQLITIGFSPVLSRLYDPDDFGLYGTFVSIAGVLSAAITLQYSEALMLPERDEKAAGLFWASVAATLGITLLFSIPWLLFPSWWLGLLRIPELRGWLWLVPLAALLSGLNQTLLAWCSRRKAFRRAASAQVARSLAANSTQTAAGAGGAGAGGLVGGAMAGDLLANLCLLFSVGREDRAVLRAGANRLSVVAGAREHKDFALYSAPQNLLNAASQGAPVILLMACYGAVIGGAYAFALRVLQMPMSFLLSSLRPVLFQKLSEVHNGGGDLQALFAKTTATLLGLSLIPAALGFALAPWLFGLVFSAKWVVAGEYARWLLIWLVPAFCNLPAALAGRILHQQRNLLLFDLGLLVSRVSVLVVGGNFWSPLQTIVAFSLVGAAFNGFLILFIARLLRRHEAARVRTMATMDSRPH